MERFFINVFIFKIEQEGRNITSMNERQSSQTKLSSWIVFSFFKKMNGNTEADLRQIIQADLESGNTWGFIFTKNKLVLNIFLMFCTIIKHSFLKFHSILSSLCLFMCVSTHVCFCLLVFGNEGTSTGSKSKDFSVFWNYLQHLLNCQKECTEQIIVITCLLHQISRQNIFIWKSLMLTFFPKFWRLFLRYYL
jgi:hypothetical protein